MSGAITKYHLDAADVAFQRPADEVKAVDRLIRSNTEKCQSIVSLKGDSLEITRAFLFVSTDQDEQAVRHCVSGLMLSGVGLTPYRVRGNSAASTDTTIEMPTANDIVAIKLLYTPEVKPGDSIDHLMHVQDILIPKKSAN